MHQMIQIGRIIIQNPIVRDAGTKFVKAAATAGGAVAGKWVFTKITGWIDKNSQ